MPQWADSKWNSLDRFRAQHVQWFDAVHDLVRQAGVPSLELTTEELVRQPVYSVDKTYQFLSRPLHRGQSDSTAYKELGS
jgi:hypothetical protein